MNKAKLIQHATQARCDALRWRETNPALARVRQRDALALLKLAREIDHAS